jgi:hypothetical protein
MKGLVILFIFGLFLFITPSTAFSTSNCYPTDNLIFEGDTLAAYKSSLEVPNSGVKIGLKEYNPCGRGKLMIFENVIDTYLQREVELFEIQLGKDLGVLNDYEVIPLSLESDGFTLVIYKKGESTSLVDGEYLRIIGFSDSEELPIITSPPPPTSNPPPAEMETTCELPAPDDMSDFFVYIPGFSISTDSDKVINKERFALGGTRTRYAERTYEAENFKVVIGITFYQNENVAASDALVYPTKVTSKNWVETTLQDHLSHQKIISSYTSENIEYTVDIRIVDNCYKIRGFWHDYRKKSYDVGPRLEEGENRVTAIVESIVEKIDGDYYGNAETPTALPKQTMLPSTTRPPSATEPSTTSTSTSSTTTSTTSYIYFSPQTAPSTSEPVKESLNLSVRERIKDLRSSYDFSADSKKIALAIFFLTLIVAYLKD